jgi:hypothetical protein
LDFVRSRDYNSSSGSRYSVLIHLAQSVQIKQKSILLNKEWNYSMRYDMSLKDLKEGEGGHSRTVEITENGRTLI